MLHKKIKKALKSPVKIAEGIVGIGKSIFGYATSDDEYNALVAAAQTRADNLVRIAEAGNVAAGLEASALRGQAHLQAAAAEAAEKIAAENAAAIRAEGDLAISRKKKEHGSIEATTRARLAAQGRNMSSGSSKIFRKELKQENRDEIKFIDKSIQNQMKNSINQGNYISQEAQAGAAQFAAQAGAVSAAGQAGIASARAEGQNLLADAKTHKPSKGQKWFDLVVGLAETGIEFLS